MPLRLLFHLPVDLCPRPPRFLGVPPILAPGSESRIPLLMSVKECSGVGCRVTYTGVLCAVPRAGTGAKRRRAKPVTLVGEVSRMGEWESCAPYSDPWSGDHRPAGCGFAAARRGFLAGCMAWWLRLECGWRHCLRAPPDCKESVTMYWQGVGRGCNYKGEPSVYDGLQLLGSGR